MLLLSEIPETLQLSLLLFLLHAYKNLSHFGLWNSNQRLKLYFGEEYGIQMESEKGKYTSVTVRIPEKKYEG